MKNGFLFSIARGVMVAMTVLPVRSALAEPAQDIVNQWRNRFNEGDTGGIVALYMPDATVHGTLSTTLAKGPEALNVYFGAAARAKTQVEMTGHMAQTDVTPDVKVMAGFYEFSGMRLDGQAFKAPARYSFVVVRQDGKWLISHQHSSPLAQSKN